MQSIETTKAIPEAINSNLELLPNSQKLLISSLLTKAAQAKPPLANELLWRAVQEMSRSTVLGALQGEEQRLCDSIEEYRSQLKTLAGKVKKHQQK